MKKVFLLLLLIIIGESCYTQKRHPIPEKLQSTFIARTDTIESIHFLYRETLINPDKKALASLVIFLHGASGRGDDNLTPLGIPAVTSIYQYLEENGIKAYFILPQCPITESWNGIVPGSYRRRVQSQPGNQIREEKIPYVHYLMSTIQDFIATNKVDATKIYILGASMGATGVWELIATHPRYFAAGMAASGTYVGKDLSNLLHTPIICSAGTEESAYERSKILTEQLNSNGGNIIFIPLEGLNHIQACNNAFTPSNLDLLFSK